MSSELQDHITHLDDLLEQYLYALDAYQTARTALSKSLADGFFSLARANNSVAPSRRIGQDFYDYRMQASRRATVETDREQHVVSISTSDLEAATMTTEDIEEDEKKVDSKAVARDAINWYGVLVPPTLRNAQQSFVAAVEQGIPSVINHAAELRRLEINIGRLRKTIKKLEKSNVSIMQSPIIEAG